MLKPIRVRLAHLASVCLAATLSAAIVISFYNTLSQIERALPNFGFFSIRELNVAIRDIAHLQDMVTLARLAPAERESAERLSEAIDLVYIRFARQDQSPTIRGYPQYGPAVTRAQAAVEALDSILAQGPPLAVGDLEPVAAELQAIEAEMNEAYYAFGQATNAELAEIQHRLGQLNTLTAVVLSVFSALAIGVAVLLVSRHRTLRSLRRLAWHDTLTELKNRAWLVDRADGILRAAAAADEEVTLFLIDVDLFKTVNDTFGHPTGDAMLRVVGEHLAELERRYSGHAIRLGGDEFALLLPKSSASILDRLEGELRQRLNTRLDLDGTPVRLSASVGIARYPEHGADLEALLRCADYALYSAKARGGGTSARFSVEIMGHIESQHRLDAAIKNAILFDELFLDWQPQYELSSGTLSGAEALVRWRDPTTGEVVAPLDFIPAAERSELILEIDRFVLAKACRQAAAWSVDKLPDLTFSVNISAKHMQRPELPEFVRKTLEDSGLKPARLELEITESAFIENRPAALGVLSQLQALGVGVALDDFGTGYSSLSYLGDLDVTRIKIDRSFISDLMVSTSKQSVVQSIMALARSLELDVVAEGVETSEQTAFLMQLGCRYAQGFLLSRPITTEEMTRLLAARNWITPELIKGARRILAA